MSTTKASIRLDNKWLSLPEYLEVRQILNEEFAKIEAIDYKLNKNGEEIKIFFRGQALQIPMDCPIHTQHKGSVGKFISVILGDNKFIMKVLVAHRGEAPVLTPVELNGRKLEESEKGFLISDLSKLPEINSSNVEVKARLYYSEDQYKAIRYNTMKEEDGFAHIEGPAGSGKSTVAVHRAFVQIHKMWEEKKHLWSPKKAYEADLLITTYSPELAENLKLSLEKLIDIEAERLSLDDKFIHFAKSSYTIRHYHGFLDAAFTTSPEWTTKMMKRLQADANSFNSMLLTAAKEEAQAKLGKHLFHELLPNVFYFDLFENCLLQREITFADFRAMEFHNQHVSFRDSDRQFIWAIFEHYREGLLKHKQKFSYAARTLMAKPKTRPFRYIIVDEAQDFTKGEIEFLILNLASYRENKNLHGLTLLSDPTQSIFNPYFYPGEILPVSVAKHVSGTKRFFLKTSYRNPKSILKAAEHLKKRIRLTKRQQENEDYKATLIKQDFREAKVYAPAQTKPNFMWQELTTSGDTTIYKSKGQEYKDVYLKEFSMGHMHFSLQACLKKVSEHCKVSEESLSNYFFDILSFAIHSNTAAVHGNSDEAFKRLLHGKISSKDEDDVLRLMRYLLTYHDKVLKLLYVALTRTQGNFAYGLKEFTNPRFASAINELFMKLSDISEQPTDMEEVG